MIDERLKNLDDYYQEQTKEQEEIEKTISKKEFEEFIKLLEIEEWF